MKVLVTAGNTQTPIDRVRCITNIFSGRTGAQIAATAFDRGHDVTLLTSHPEVLEAIAGERPRQPPQWQVRPYRTFEDLESSMAETIPAGAFDAIVHAAAVSDYHVAGVYGPGHQELGNVSAAKVKSHFAELWLRLVPAPKLVDKIRSAWRFGGTLVKFKLEVGVSEADLLEIAERSRQQSAADLMAANTLEGMHDWAYVGSGAGRYERIARPRLAGYLVEAVERAHAARTGSGNSA